jgi:hypothetical protein
MSRVRAMPEAIFVRAGERYEATELARGPWDPGAQHGGAPAALLMRAFEQLGDGGGLALARVTYEFLRPVPLASLSVRTALVRSGKRVALLEGSLLDEGGTELVRARALRVRPAESGSAEAPDAAIPGPDAGRTVNFPVAAVRPMFATDAMDIRFTSGHFAKPGPAGAWFRLRVPLVAGEPTSPLQRLAAAADFGNGISATVSWEDHLFINPDLTLYVEREPAGDWIHLDGRTSILPEGIGLAMGTLRDDRGPVGHAAQALVVQRTR